MKNLSLWMGALVVGAVLGLLQVDAIDATMNVVATIYTRLFQLLAVPTIVLAVTLTLSSMGTGRHTGRLFRRTLGYTLVTTLCAAAVGAVLYCAIESPFAGGGDPAPVADVPPAAEGEAATTSWGEHLIGVVPDNIVRPLLDGNVLSLLLLAFAVGIGLSRLPESEGKTVVMHGLQGLQDLLYVLIRGLIWSLPLGIVAFSAQLAHMVVGGPAAADGGSAGALLTYALIVLAGNAIQFFVVLPLFLVARGIHPLRTLAAMGPAVLMALFTKSSAATLPVTLASAERRLGIRSEIARFVLPICTTINMNGCAAFILVTSLFVMQQAGMPITPSTVVLWLGIAVVTAVGNAGVPMGCYFLTFSLMSGIGAPLGVLGLILPIYTVIDMVETAENVWSDSCVCAMINRDTSHDVE